MYRLQSIFVDFVLNLYQRVPGPVIHNLSKARMLKILAWHANVDDLPGDYLEFGVAHGNSIRSAQLAFQHSNFKKIGVKSISRKIWGFDTFERFISENELDSHPLWNGDKFNVPLEKVRKRFKTKDISFIKVDANNLFKDGNITSPSEFRINAKAAFILFDMDLYSPTFSALVFSRSLLQQGTFLIFDEYFSFKGDFNKGEAKALSDFMFMYPEVELRDFMNYGSGGKVFIVSSVG